MKVQFTATSRLTLEHNQEDETSRHHSTEVRLECSNNLDTRRYADRGIPKKEGVKPLTLALTQGLIANIHAAHDSEYWDSAKHLRFIIDELELGFVQTSPVQQGIFEDKPNT